MEEKNLFSFFGNSFLEIQFTYHAVHVFKLCDCIKRYSTLLIIREMQIKTTMRYQLTLVRSSSVQSLSRVWLFATPWTAALQASLSITNSRSLLKLMSVKSVMPSKHLILCRPLLLLPSIFPSISIFSTESVFCIRWPKDWQLQLHLQPFLWIFRTDIL